MPRLFCLRTKTARPRRPNCKTSCWLAFVSLRRMRLGTLSAWPTTSPPARLVLAHPSMDYPHPWITLDSNGQPDLSHAYSVGIGAWDKVAIQYGYSQFPSGSDMRLALDSILRKAQTAGLYFISDADSRPPGSAHPHAHLWDNGPDSAAELDRIRKFAAQPWRSLGRAP